MNFQYKLRNLKNTFDIVMNEIQAVRNNIAFTESFVVSSMAANETKMLDTFQLQSELATNLAFYDTSISEMQSLIDVLRKLNTNLEIFQVQCKAKSQIYPELTNLLNNNNTNSKDAKKEFSYQKFDLSKFEIGQEYNACITYLVDKDNLIFHMCEVQSDEIKKSVHLSSLKETTALPKYSSFPAKEEMFALDLDGSLFRVVRAKAHCSYSNSIKVLLLDYGEIVEEATLENMYVLPDEYKSFSSLFFTCHLKTINNKTTFDMVKYVEDKVFRHVKFNIIYKDNDVLHVNIIDTTLDKKISKSNPFLDSSFSDEESPEQLDPTKVEVTDEMVNSKKIEVSNKVSATLKSFLEHNSFHSSKPNEFDMSSISSTSLPEIDVGDLARDDKRILFEEPLNTTNAMKAVMGYNPKDDKTICKFYDPSTGGCFKGNRCKFEHVEKIVDGWTRDTCAVVTSISNTIALPKVGKKQKIIPTHILTTNRFYCHLVESTYNSSLLALCLEMNAPEETVHMRTYSQEALPQTQDLVFAQFNDGLWYRAKIVVVYEHDNYKVFYVDYGNFEVVSINRLRQWNSKFDYLPFQAVHCFLAGIQEIVNKRSQGIHFLRNEILNRELTVEVIDNAGGLCVKNLDLTDLIISKQLATEIPVPDLNTNYHRVPA